MFCLPQPSRESLCLVSHKPISGAYYIVPEGKVLKDYFDQYRARPR